ncbi:hypothetical protein nbrc107697_13470 [Gordonia crocea]|uniref:Uncharacterized protein n=1 Tax=Gordonia crocea TaxID=589162 RepID=A0A7I9UVV6_9ACTN|nr:hypothetical protein nbrc107697_13470 [Gordonia crocea]
MIAMWPITRKISTMPEKRMNSQAYFSKLPPLRMRGERGESSDGGRSWETRRVFAVCGAAVVMVSGPLRTRE